MATYIVGDIQGCLAELEQLLIRVDFDPLNDELWLAGDLVARGPQSLATLRYVRSLGSQAQIVLGNHDLHLIASWLGFAKVKKKDQTAAILSAPDCDELMHWLRQQPLIVEHPQHQFIMVHAGISPQWAPQQALQLAEEVHQVLRGDHYAEFFQHMYGDLPNAWSDDLAGFARLRFIVNVLTRMRYCYADGSLDFQNKQPPQSNTNVSLKPWFEIEGPHIGAQPILFGHWAALMGATNRRDVIGLDTGCVWGNQLTMIRWQDQTLFSQSSLSQRTA